ncbi:MAG: IPT/TIG domain-containing protein [Gemmatimonadota bacterium]|nr:IPT/TIG domain-containing protein [Gemmatimonadota bacterium]
MATSSSKARPQGKRAKGRSSTAGPVTVACVAATPAGPPILPLRGLGGFFLVLALCLALILAWFSPMFSDIQHAYKEREEHLAALQPLLLSASRGAYTQEERQSIVKAISDPPVGLRGLARSLLAFIILSLVVFAMILLLGSATSDDQELKRVIVTGLVSILGTIVGFYFGSRASENAAAAAASSAPSPPVAPPPPAPPTISSIDPTVGPIGTPVSVVGAQFNEVATVMFGAAPAAHIVASPTAITAYVPPGAESGPISVTTAAGTAVSPIPFTVT